MLICYVSSLPLPISGVVVDGVRKDELSASKHQKTNEQLSIDAFNTRSCGISDPNADEHEFVNMAREGQFPWLVSFQIKIMSGANYTKQLEVAQKREPETEAEGGRQRKMEDLHFCSGSFISDKWILSAAHCFVGETLENYLKNDKLKVVAGSHKVSSRTSLNKNISIERIYYHSQFDKSIPVGYDIALVELSDRVEFSNKRQQNEFGEQRGPFMNAICLPKRDNKYKFNESARIAGWGLSRAEDVHTMPSKLLTTDILLAKREECAAEYAKRLHADRILKQDDFLCASYKTTRDSCQSDSGGPLMQYVNKKAVAIGIVSYGIACATKGVPGLYTKTSAYINWVKDITKNGPDASVDFKMLESQRAKQARDERKAKEEAKETSSSTQNLDEFKFLDQR